jgi:hypothetical protein
MLNMRIDYALPPNGENIEILRVVVRESMGADLMDMLISDILSTTETLMKSDEVDLASFAQAQAPRLERSVTSMGRGGWLKGKGWFGRKGDHKRGGTVFNTTC